MRTQCSSGRRRENLLLKNKFHRGLKIQLKCSNPEIATFPTRIQSKLYCNGRTSAQAIRHRHRHPFPQTSICGDSQSKLQSSAPPCLKWLNFNARVGKPFVRASILQEPSYNSQRDGFIQSFEVQTLNRDNRQSNKHFPANDNRL